MKSQIALFLGIASAVKLNDAPPYWPGPTWTYNHPSAAGFLQTSACTESGVMGVTCGPSDVELFATGMNGDEDLGQDITMKGEKFHYNQANLVQFATGMNGDEDLGQDITMKGEKFHYQQSPEDHKLV